MKIRSAAWSIDGDTALALWREFIAGAPADLGWQGNEAEFAHLPGGYAPPGGGVLLAEADDAAGGCVAFRDVGAALCEMKRLFVRPEYRGGRGAGHALVAHVVAAARAAGYREMRLDVLAPSLAARALYRAMGFVAAPPVSANPVAGASFLGLVL